MTWLLFDFSIFALNKKEKFRSKKKFKETASKSSSISIWDQYNCLKYHLSLKILRKNQKKKNCDPLFKTVDNECPNIRILFSIKIFEMYSMKKIPINLS